jgi:hypothetical protein
MEFKRDNFDKYLKKSVIETEEIPSLENKKVLTNIEAVEQGTFPEKLLEKVNLPKMKSSDYLNNEIKPKHTEILKKRPVPEMLDNAKMIDNIKTIDPPSLGAFYEEKKVDETMKKEKYPNKF